MPAKAKYTEAEKAKLLKQTAKLSTKEAALKLEVSVNTLNKWRKDAETTSATAPADTAEKATTTVKVTKTAPKVNGKVLKQTIKAVANINKSLEVLNKFIEEVA